MTSDFPNVVSENCFLHNVEDYIQAKFDELCQEHNIKSINIKTILEYVGLGRKGDFLLTLRNRNFCQILSLVDSVILRLKGRILTVGYFKESSQLIFNLNRCVAYQSVLQEVVELKERYALKKLQHCILVVIHADDGVFSSLRNNLVAEHLISFLATNGHTVYYKNYSACKVSYVSENVKQYKCSEKCLLNETRSQWEETLKCSKWIVKSNNSQSLILDGQKYLQSCLSSHYNKNIMNITVKNETFSYCFEKFLEIVHILTGHMTETPNHIFHIVPQNKELVIQQSGLLLEMVFDKELSQSYIVHQKASLKCPSDITVNDYFAAKKEELQTSLMHKYGLHVLQSDAWKSCLETLVQTAVKFDVLFTSLSISLKLELQESKEYKSDKGGTFVQYNYARLSMLFKSYHDKVDKCYYEKLPTIENVDFSILTLEEEWNLFKFILTFPKMVEDILEHLNVKNATKPGFLSHKVCQMLVNLSRQLSIYYSKVHILGGQQSHLQKRMFAQLYLLMSIHQVMKNGLMLLNIHGLHQM